MARPKLFKATAENTVNGKITDAVKAPQHKRFYCVRASKHTFFVDAFDDDGKRVPKLDKNGQAMFVNGSKVWQEMMYTFTTISNKPDKFLCEFVYDPDKHSPEVLKHLEHHASIKGDMILSEDDYNAQYNSAAFAERRVAKAEEEAATYRDALAEARAEIERLSRGA